ITGATNDRYKFRTSPIRNVALQPAFFHNGAFTRLEDAVRHHLDVFTSARNYSPGAAGVAPDLMAPMGPIESVLARVDPILATPMNLTDEEFSQLVDFVRNGLLDQRAKPRNLPKLIPRSVPSGFFVLKFEKVGLYSNNRLKKLPNCQRAGNGLGHRHRPPRRPSRSQRLIAQSCAHSRQSSLVIVAIEGQRRCADGFAQCFVSSCRTTRRWSE